MRCALPSCAALLAACVASRGPAAAPAGVQLPPELRVALLVADERERELVRKGWVLDDAPLELYVMEVASRLAPPEAFAALRIRARILSDPHPIAFALANGATFVTTGLLALLESEAELAAVLAHEMARLANRHFLLKPPRRRSGGGTPDRRVPSEAEFRHALDLEADAEALARMRQAGYDLSAAPRALARMRADEASKEPEPGEARAPAPRAPYRRLDARIAACERLVAGWGATGGVTRADAFAAETARLLLPVARAHLAAGRLDAARAAVDRRVGRAPSDAEAHFLRGEIARREATEPSLQVATAAYRRALELDSTRAEAWRGLGFTLSKQGDPAGAREAFLRYLQLAPQAPDRAHVEAALRAEPTRPE